MLEAMHRKAANIHESGLKTNIIIQIHIYLILQYICIYTKGSCNFITANVYLEERAVSFSSGFKSKLQGPRRKLRQLGMHHKVLLYVLDLHT